MRIHSDQTLQIEVVTKFDYITSPKFTTIFRNGNCYDLRPLDRRKGPLRGFSQRLRNALSNPTLKCSFAVCKREDEISLMVDQFKYHLRLKTKIESVRASEKRKIVESDEPPSSKIPRVIEVTEAPTGHISSIIEESILPVGNYSGEYNKRCTVGMLLEVVGSPPVVKLQLKPFRDEPARSTGEMTLTRDNRGDCFRVKSYNAESIAVLFTWAAKATAFRFIPSLARMRICPTSGSGVEIFIGGEMVKLERVG
ncbi:hypothetical protein FOZ60_008829 [Perkinsus olseni]|uniref:Uncharacterized protein n=1 Tax=Perkinsus olseni TaxID=32597 RepID=A0A7J6NIE6_PEROL|nr:hypothetical protein FOZ60_008829 [Perkinsus olseni]